jgi:hypothetical protein
MLGRRHSIEQASSANVEGNFDQRQEPDRVSAAQTEVDDTPTPTPTVVSESHLFPEQNQDAAGSDFWADVEGLQPSSLLNKQATKGKYSLRNILSFNHRLHLDKSKGVPSLSEDDPITKGIVSFHIATSLFEG